ncbi:HicB (plasmid) [Piscirickettsia salmonis]|uniref:HicB n=1 Tax=Piscirickettsia salmonis TaxID=1238 RepID=A0AAC8VLM8_PISSA|nr:HicB [Piscirickettsia salmonis]
MLKYKGYIGKVEEIHEGDEYIYGIVPNIKDVISFRGKI